MAIAGRQRQERRSKQLLFHRMATTMGLLPEPMHASYSSQGYQRQRQLTLGDLLLENRIIFLQGTVYDEMANLIVAQMLYLQFEDPKRDISLRRSTAAPLSRIPDFAPP